MSRTSSKTKTGSKRWKVRLLTWLGLLVFGLGYTAYEVMVSYPATPGPGNGSDVVVQVRRGAGPGEIARSLKDRGLIDSVGRFTLWVRATGGMPRVRAGEFVLQSDMTPKEILDALSGRATAKGVRVTVPEGYTLSRIAEVLEGQELVAPSDFRAAVFDKEFLASLGIPGDSAEGYLFPDTYYFKKDVSPEAIIKRMHDNFLRKAASLGVPEGTDMEAVVILASIVQAEAQVVSEAPIIAGVYSNRLDPKKFPLGRLQADPTVSYGCDPFVATAPSCGTFKGTLGRKQLDDPANPWNTYRHEGLPPGPICMPGIHALKAAAFPKEVDYLYFVAKKGGRHTFSSTLAAHNKAVKAYRAGR